MRYTPDHKSITHKKIVNTASELFRSKSMADVGVSDLMSRAGLTHGGFYAHFNSKEQLAAEAIRSAFEEAGAQLKQVMRETRPGRKFATTVEHYLNSPHRDNPGKGCMAAALASEVAHHPGPIRDAMTAGVKRWVDGVERMSAEDGLQLDSHTAIATMVGAIVLSRAMADPQLADQFILRARAMLLATIKAATPAKRRAKSKRG